MYRFFLITTVILCNFSYGLSTNFHNDYNNRKLLENIYISNNEIKINTAKNGYKSSLEGNHFLKMIINNNAESGYKIFARSLNGALVRVGNDGREGSVINYLLRCNEFQTAQDGFFVENFPASKMTKQKKTLIYHVRKPTNVTENAKTFCSIELPDNEKLLENFSGEYSDTVEITMTTNPS